MDSGETSGAREDTLFEFPSGFSASTGVGFCGSSLVLRELFTCNFSFMDTTWLFADGAAGNAVGVLNCLALNSTGRATGFPGTLNDTGLKAEENIPGLLLFVSGPIQLRGRSSTENELRFRAVLIGLGGVLGFDTLSWDFSTFFLFVSSTIQLLGRSSTENELRFRALLIGLGGALGFETLSWDFSTFLLLVSGPTQLRGRSSTENELRFRNELLGLGGALGSGASSRDFTAAFAAEETKLRSAARSE